jgi:small subunit ribosomal protein S21
MHQGCIQNEVGGLGHGTFLPSPWFRSLDKLGALCYSATSCFEFQLEPRKVVTPTMQVSVRDNNVDQALRALKKKLQREGVFREMKLKQHYEKPSEKKAREKAEAIRRARKLARKKAQREGLL